MEALGVPAPSRFTPEGLLRAYMVKVFAMRDSAGVADMLHEDFSGLSFLESGGSFAFTRAILLEGIGRHFSDSTITGINLSVLIHDSQRSTDEGCPDCRAVNTTWTERISKVGNSGADTYTHDATFYITRDPRNAQQWVIWKWIVRPTGYVLFSPDGLIAAR